MTTQKALRTTLLTTLFVLVAPTLWATPKYQVLYGFTNGVDGGGLWSSVVFDTKGNLYGTTSGGGVYGYGTVFQLTPGQSGQWTENVIHNFPRDFKDGYEPFGGPAFGPDGNLYGATRYGGTRDLGAVYQVIRGPSGWAETVLYDIGDNPEDEINPSATLAIDETGNLFGTAPNSGAVFEVSPGPTGWTESVLYNFCSKPQCSDGYEPFSGLILDGKGSLYGTTDAGGNYPPACPVSGGCGVVFKVKPNPDGSWKYRVLHRFAAFKTDGVAATGELVLDPAGSLYGATDQGGRYTCWGTMGCGTVYKLTPQPNGHWKETILHNFRQNKNGYNPSAGVVLDPAGNLYGTTGFGGGTCNCGVVYKLAPSPDGSWTYTVLHSFTGDDGASPAANLIFDDQGNLYGTTVLGGPGGAGVVFEITP